ncbi:MAG TPA: amino acid adenylation domain-containing protein, partial [Longimicrobium sp.]|nr:amino acid adenylation domain-containing protein [Longimicrobium sp.]
MSEHGTFGSGGSGPGEAAPRVCCAHHLFEARAAVTPNAPAVISESVSLTYAELDQLASRLARRLAAAGVGPEVRVGVHVEHVPELAVAVLGVMKAGGVHVPLDPTYPAERIRFVLEDCGAVLVLADAASAPRLADVELPVWSIASLVADAAADTLPAPGPTYPEALAYVIYTSGSTGVPKGVGVSHAALASLAPAVRAAFGIVEGDRVPALSATGFDVSVHELFGTWGNGATVLFRPPGVPLYGERFVEWLGRARVTSMTLTTSLWHNWVADLDAGGLSIPDSLRTVMTGGERASPTAYAAWSRMVGSRVKLINAYGPTEATVFTTAWPTPGHAIDGDLPIGVALENGPVYVLDGMLRLVADGAEGEVCVAGARVAREYLNRPAMTAEHFVPDPFGAPGSRMYRSGDLGAWNPSGQLEFRGRADNQVKVGGFRVEPGEVEAALESHPEVASAAVVARRDGGGAARLLAYAVPRDGAELGEAELREWLRERVPVFAIPASVMILDAFPLNPNGKVDRGALPQPPAETAGDAPRGAVEEALAAMWTEVLGRPAIGRDDDFFALGGHSLPALQLLSRVRREWGVELPVRSLFDTPTVAGLAATVHAARAGGTAATDAIVARGGEPMALSFGQERLWFLHRLEPESPFYNIPAAVRLRGELDVEALRGALGEIVSRHQVLRTVFVPGADGTRPRLLPAGDFPLEVVDVSASAPGEAERLARAEAERPFDLRHDLALRAILLREAGDDHLLVLGLHHVAGDGWSIGVLYRELAAAYSAFARGEMPRLAPLPAQYADYAAWQRERMASGALDAEMEYWREQLGDAPATLDLPTDHPRPAVQSFRGDVRRFRVEPELVSRVATLARGEDATPFMALMAAFALLLGRLSGRSDVVVGSPIAGRSRPETEELIGFFVNTVALRTRLEGDPSFRELLRAVRETTLDAFARHELPFERVVEAVRPERSRAHNPLFQVAFALQTQAMEPVRLDSVAMEPDELDTGTAKFDLYLELTPEADGGMRGALEYATDLWEPESATRMTELFVALLERVAAAPDVAASRALPAASEDGWNETARPYPREASIPALFAEVAARAPAAVALTWDGGRMTYGELDASSNRLANHLRRLGVGPDVPVAVALERSPAAIVAVMAVLKAGGAYMAIDPGFPRPRMALMLEDSGARVVVTDGPAAARLPDHDGARVLVDRDAAAIARECAVAPEVAVHAENAAYVSYTSGSTGRPKGVIATHRGVVRLVLGAGYARFAPDETWLQLAPLGFDASTLELWGPLLHGGRLALFPARIPSAGDLGSFIREHGVTALWLTTGLLHAVVDDDVDEVRGVRQLLTGGEVISVSHARRILEAHPGLRLVHAYGPTENTTFTTCH